MSQHVHPCPECYEHPVCPFYDCYIEPDLQRDDGTPSGAHVVCRPCTERLLRERNEEAVDRCTHGRTAIEDIARDTPATIVIPGVKCRYCKVRWQDEIEHAALPGQQFMSLRGPKSCSMCEPSSSVDRRVFSFFPFYIPATILRCEDAKVQPDIDNPHTKRIFSPVPALTVQEETPPSGPSAEPRASLWWVMASRKFPLISNAYPNARLIIGFRLGDEG